MIIGPSKRQTRPKTTKAARSSLSLHRDLARRRYWQLRLTACSAGALALSVLAWLAGMGFVWHLGSVILGFALGFLWPLHTLPAWALNWIENRAGLSYRTALELHAPDRYGFHEAVAERAHRAVMRLEPPAMQPWWLPLLALAVGLLLLPTITLPGGNPVNLPGATNVQPNSPTSPQPTPETPLQPEGATTPDGTPPAETQAPERQEAEAPELGRDFDTVSGTDARNPSQGTPPDSDTLSRFLENMREREPRPEDPGETGNETANQGRAPQQGMQEPSGTPDNRQNGEGSNAANSPEGQRQQEGTGEPGGENAGEQATQGSQNGQQGQNGTEQNPAGEQAGAGENGQEQEGAQGATPSQQPGEGEPATNDQSGGQATQGQQGGEGKPLEDGASDSAGAGPSTPMPSTGLEGEPSGEPELLEGRLEEGLTNRGGEVLLPGSPEVGLPEGASAGDFERALERAISEGEIPVEYQEILRNYFR